MGPLCSQKIFEVVEKKKKKKKKKNPDIVFFFVCVFLCFFFFFVNWKRVENFLYQTCDRTLNLGIIIVNMNGRSLHDV